MKHVYYILLALVLVEPAAAQWVTLDNGPLADGTGRHDDIVFISETTGWIVNGNQQVHKTTDYGETWDQISTIPAFLRSVGFKNEQQGWVGTLAADRLLWETVDGGETWADITDRITGAKPTGVCGMWVVNDTLAFGVGTFNGPPVVIRTADGGASWTGTDLSFLGVGTLVDVYFRDADTGFAVGGTSDQLDGNTVVVRTDDGGLTWQLAFEQPQQPGVGGEWGWKISFPNPDTGYVAVEYPFTNSTGVNARFLKTTNGGDTWQVGEVTGSTAPAGLQGIGFVSPMVGWAGGRGDPFMTTDGGETWQKATGSFIISGSPNDGMDRKINRVRVVSDSVAYAVGKGVYRFLSGSTPVNVEPLPSAPSLFTLNQNYPNPFRPSTTIGYDLHQQAHVRVRVIDVLGKTMRVLVDEMQVAGSHAVTWNGLDQAGRRVASGTYMYVIDIGPLIEMKMMVMLN